MNIHGIIIATIKHWFGIALPSVILDLFVFSQSVHMLPIPSESLIVRIRDFIIEISSLLLVRYLCLFEDIQYLMRGVPKHRSVLLVMFA